MALTGIDRRHLALLRATTLAILLVVTVERIWLG
jgi:hypothetical protein